MPAVSERKLLFLLAGVQFANILDFVMMMPLGPLFIADLHITPAELGLLVSSYTIAASLSSLVIGRWVNEQPRKRALLTFWSLFAVATAACGLAHHYYGLLAARVLAGLAGGPATSIVITIVADAVPPARRGRALAFVQSAFSVASVVGVPAGLYLANASSWRLPFLVLGVIALAQWFVLWAFLPRFDAHVSAARGAGSFWQTMGSVLADPGSRRAYVTHALVMGAGFSLIPYLSPFLVNNRGVQAADLGLFYLAGGLCTFVLMQYIGRLTDRYGSLRVYGTAAVLMSVNIQFFLFLPVAGRWMIPMFAAFMVLNASRMVPLMSLYSRIPPAATRGAFMSYLSTVQHLASGLGTLVTGYFMTMHAGRLRNFEFAAEAAVAVGLSVILLARSLARYGTDAALPLAAPGTDAA